MIQVTRDEPYIYLATSQCPSTDRTYKTFLEIGCFNANLDVAEHDGTLKIGPVPESCPTGVGYLHVRAGHVGHFMLVNVDMQCKLSVASSHTPTNPNAGDTIIECVPEDKGENDGNGETASVQLDSEGLSA